MKLAIFADWLPTYGGAEHVIAALHECWPEAPIFTTVARPAALGPLGKANLRPHRFLQIIFRILGRHQYLLSLMPRAIESVDVGSYDVILSSSHAVGKGVIPSARAVHICYCHTPMRYAWEMEAEYLSDFRIRGFLRRFVQSQLKKLRRWDMSTAKRVDVFLANSTETSERIERIYGRKSMVISPPVDDRFFQIPLPVRISSPASYYLALGRLVPYKRFDLLIELANRMHFPLKIGGTGSDMERLKRLAGPTVEFLGYIDDADLPALYTGATCLLFPQIEDAGIVPLEAQACGVPVLAYNKGGIRDVVQHGITGILVKAQTVDAFAEGIREIRERLWDPSTIRRHAATFQLSAFKKRIQEEVQRAYEHYRI